MYGQEATKKETPTRKVSKTSVKQNKKKVKGGRSVKPAKRKLGANPSHPQNSMALVTVPIEEINTPIMYKGKLSIIPTPFTERQIARLIAPTPKEVILQRPGKGGKTFDYIPGWYFKKNLNFTFGWMHDFEVLGERVDGDFVTVKGKLTINNAKGQKLISKTDFGGSEIKYLTESVPDGKGGFKRKSLPHKPENYVDISNDFKAAATDCLKRCAVQLGMGLDVYSKGEYEGARKSQPEQPPAPQRRTDNVIEAEVITPRPVSGSEPFRVEYECHECGNPMTKAEVDFCKKMRKRQLCRACQKAGR